LDEARLRLERVIENVGRVQYKFALENVPEAGPILQTIQRLISKAQWELAAGNTPAVFGYCYQIDFRISELYALGSKRVTAQPWPNTQNPPGGFGSYDSARILKEQKIRAEWELERALERFTSLSQRLESDKAPRQAGSAEKSRAVELMEKVRMLLAAARQEIDADRPWIASSHLRQAEALFPELQRLSLNASPLAQATDTYRRVLDRVTRLKEQSNASEDPKSALHRDRVQDLLEKAKEALATGQAEVAKEFSLRAEAMLPDWHRSISASTGGRLSPASWQRLKAKLEKASEIVSASGNDKAAKILEKGRNHFERAERSHSEGQVAKAQVEMDIALKLAAKAVDIARSRAR